MATWIESGQVSAQLRPFVSVIVPVYNDEERVGRCIAALLDQSYPADRYEVLIVDNGSTDRTLEVVRRFPVRLLIEDRSQGSYAARNTGLAHACGEIIAFTDSDCVPAHDWIECGVESLLRAGRCAVVAGNIEVFVRDPRRPTIAERYDSLWGFPQARYVEAGFAPTANLFAHRSTIDAVGPFNARLKSGGDREWGFRATGMGFQVAYAARAIVRHPARESVRAICAKARRVIGGDHDIRRSAPTFGQNLRHVANSARGLPSRIHEVWTDERIDGLRPRVEMVMVVLLLFAVRNVEWLRLQLGGTSLRR